MVTYGTKAWILDNQVWGDVWQQKLLKIPYVDDVTKEKVLQTGDQNESQLVKLGSCKVLQSDIMPQESRKRLTVNAKTDAGKEKALWSGLALSAVATLTGWLTKSPMLIKRLW